MISDHPDLVAKLRRIGFVVTVIPEGTGAALAHRQSTRTWDMVRTHKGGGPGRLQRDRSQRGPSAMLSVEEMLVDEGVLPARDHLNEAEERARRLADRLGQDLPKVWWEKAPRPPEWKRLEETS